MAGAAARGESGERTVRMLLAVVGRPRDAALAAAARAYEARAARYWPLEVLEVREEQARGVTPEQVRQREGERLAARVGAARLVACDPGGVDMPSERFAGWLREAREGARDLALLVGGAYGLDASLLARAELRLSLAPWTLPHELARVVLAEQLYRAGTILRREPYHK